MHKYLCELGAYLMKKLFEKFISKTEAYLNLKKELMEKEQKITELENEKSYLAIKWSAREEINLLKQKLENSSLRIKELEKDIEMKDFILSLNERSRNDNVEVVNSLKLQLNITHERLLQQICKTKSDNEIDFAVVSVKTVEVREQYDVTDRIIYIENGVLKKLFVTTSCGVGQEVFEKKSVEELKGLDQREQIYYD